MRPRRSCSRATCRATPVVLYRKDAISCVTPYFLAIVSGVSPLRACERSRGRGNRIVAPRVVASSSCWAWQVRNGTPSNSLISLSSWPRIRCANSCAMSLTCRSGERSGLTTMKWRPSTSKVQAEKAKLWMDSISSRRRSSTSSDASTTAVSKVPATARMSMGSLTLGFSRCLSVTSWLTWGDVLKSGADQGKTLSRSLATVCYVSRCF